MKQAVRDNLLEYAVWDRVTRWFHWINFSCVIGLAGLGTVILFAGGLGVTNDGKVALKTLHALIGYVFVLNLLWRVIWGFTGNRYARWKAILPFGKGYMRQAREYSSGFMGGCAPGWLGHNPLGKLMIGAALPCDARHGGHGANPRLDGHLLPASRLYDEGVGCRRPREGRRGQAVLEGECK